MAPLLLWLALATRSTPAATVAVYEPELALHRQVVERLVHEHPSVRAVPLKAFETAKLASPRALIAIGEASVNAARQRWPNVPLAAALVWTVVDADLVVLAHPAVACTVARLRELPGEGPWVVAAAAADSDARLLAEQLGAHLITGSASQLVRALNETKATRFWFRASPALTDLALLEALGRLNAIEKLYVGSDAPGLARFGLATPITIDGDEVAARLRGWLQRAELRATKTRPMTVEAAPCAAT